jgi:hypothetical protein
MCARSSDNALWWACCKAGDPASHVPPTVARRYTTACDETQQPQDSASCFVMRPTCHWHAYAHAPPSSPHCPTPAAAPSAAEPPPCRPCAAAAAELPCTSLDSAAAAAARRCASSSRPAGAPVALRNASSTAARSSSVTVSAIIVVRAASLPAWHAQRMQHKQPARACVRQPPT